MAHVYQVKVTVNKPSERIVNVVAESAEEAQGKVTVEEGEAIVEVADAGEVVQ